MKNTKINIPVGSGINQAIERLYQSSKATIQAIGAFASIEKREIKTLVDGVIKIQEDYAYIEDSNKLKDIDILTSLYLSAYPKTDRKNDKAFGRFYACYRNCKTYHYGKSSKRSGKSSAAKTVTREQVIAFLKSMSAEDRAELLKEVK